MQGHTTTTAAVATAVGVLATAAAFYVLTEDAWRTGAWSTDQIVALPLIMATVGAGFLAPRALRHWKVATALGLALAFAAGSAVTVYNSMGRQSTVALREAADATARNAARVEAHKAFIEATNRRRTASDALDAACIARANVRQCDAATKLLNQRKQDVREAEATMAALGGDDVIAPKAAGMARLVAVFGINEDAARDFFQRAEPGALTTVLELIAIFAFHLAGGMGALRLSAGTTPPGARQIDATPAVVDAPRLKLVATRPATSAPAHPVIAALLTARRPLSNRELAAALGCSEGEATKRRAEVAPRLVTHREGRELRISVAG